MNEPLTWAALVTALGALGWVIKTSIAVGSRLTDSDRKADAAQSLANAVSGRLEHRIAMGDEIRSKTGERIAVLESVQQATSQSLISMEGRLVKSIEELTSQLASLRQTIIDSVPQSRNRMGRRK